MNPVMLHADGTDCRHQGQPQATMHAEGGPRCPAGLSVTHVRFNGKVLTVEEAAEAFQAMTRAFGEAFAHLAEAYTGMGRAVGSAMAPTPRAVAAMTEGGKSGVAP